MKKLIALLALCLFAVQLQAQDVNLLNSIRAANGKIKTFEADL